MLLAVSGLSCASIAGLDDYGTANTGGAGGVGGTGGSATGSTTTGTGGAGPTTAYVEAVLNSGPAYYWRLGDEDIADGLPAVAELGGVDGAYGGLVSLAAGLVADSDGAARFEPDGRMTVPAQSLGLMPGRPGTGTVADGFTVELWFQADGSSGSGTLASLRSDVGWAFRLRLENGDLYFDVAPLQGTGTIGPVSVGSGVHHVAATWRGGDQAGMFVVCLFVDGAQDCSGENWGSFATPVPSAHLVVAAEEADPGGATQAHFDGVIDEVAIYVPELSDSDVSEHFEVGSP